VTAAGRPARSIAEMPTAWLLWTVYLIALAVRVAAAIAVDGFRHPQVQEYDTIARNLLAGRGFTFEQLGVVYHAYIAPLPAWLSAASYSLAGSLVVAMVVQVAVGAAVAPAAAAVAQRLFGRPVAAFIAGVLVATHPGLTLYTSGKLHALAFDALFFTLALLQSLRVASAPTFRRSLLLGAIVGIGAMSRGTIVIFLPITALWAIARAPRPERRRLVVAMVVATVVAGTVIAPWSIRNTRLLGRFVWLLTTDSEVFWRGNNPYATGTSYAADGKRIILELLPPEEMRGLVSQPDELAQAAWFSSRSHAFIRDHPGAFVRLTLKKLFYFWWFSPQMGLNYPATWLRLYEAYYVVMLAAALVGLRRIVSGDGDRQAALLVVAYLVALSALQSFYYVEGRHRWAIEPMMLAMSGGGLAALVDADLRQRRRRAVDDRPVPAHGEAHQP